jgi:hypothetical protein
MGYENYHQYQMCASYDYLKTNMLQLKALLQMQDYSKDKEKEIQKRYENEKQYVNDNVHRFCIRASMLITQDFPSAVEIADNKMRPISTWQEDLKDVPKSNIEILDKVYNEAQSAAIKYNLLTAFNGITALLGAVFFVLGWKTNQPPKLPQQD